MFSIKKFLHSFTFALQGVKQTFISEQNMRVHTFIALAVIVAGFCFKISHLEWIAVVGCIGLVFAAEIFNTAIENLVDYVSLERNPIAAKIKDLSAAAVLVCAIIAVIIGCLIFIPKIC